MISHTLSVDDREAVKSARQLDGEFASDDVPSHPPFARSVKIYAFLLYNGVRVGKAVVTYGMLIVNSKKDIHRPRSKNIRTGVIVFTLIQNVPSYMSSY